MKTLLGSRFAWLWACGASLLTYVCTCGYSPAAQPAISNIFPAGTNVMVEVTVPAGFHRVTLQTRTRLGSGAWMPAAVGQNDGSATTLRFKIPRTSQAELIRVQADAQQPLPSGFYSGTNRFTAPLGNPGPALGPPGSVAVNGGTAGASSGDASRAVVESDIWRIDGNRIYFFNQYRGLQVIDISVPDNAAVLGTLSLPAAGEQMYLADSNHVVLLANTPCNYGLNQSEIIVVAVSNKAPVVVTNLPVGGWFQDSRMVGTALYIATQTYQPSGVTNYTEWQWGTQVSAFDLSDPEKPVARNTLWFPGYGNVVSATDTYLFVAMLDPASWWQSLIQIIDITSPDGTMSQVSSVSTAGRVADKFKLNYTNGVFTAISEDWRWNTGSGPITRLETFRVPDPRSMGPGTIVKLGQLELGSGEQLHATRFDGNLVYVVTFFQIDPLWVVDLSDPTQPRIVGSVDVPGWSSYIAPMGDRLVTVGLESHQHVAVSLFDVHDPTHPSLLSHLVLGKNYSWSDATSDEKAFTVLSDQGLVLVPYDGDTTNGWTSQLQLIDLSRTNLVARGIVHHQIQARRTAFAQGRVLSLSGWELLSVDVTDRDMPSVKGATQLAWPVDRVFATGDYLLELSSSSGWWGFQAPPSIRVTPAHVHDTVLTTLSLNNFPVVGASLKNDRLYVAQSAGYFYPIPLDGPAGGAGGPSTNPPDFFLTILDTSHLPNVTVLGQTSVFAGVPGWGTSWTGLWMNDNLLVWGRGGQYYMWAIPVGGVGFGPMGPIGIAPGFFPWWGPGGQLLAFDVGNPAAPSFDSKVDLSTNGWWTFSSPFASGTRVYLSHSEYFLETNSTYPDGTWSQAYQLDVVDYADPINPTLRKPVNIPGTLQGVSHQGELLYTLGYQWDANGNPDWTQRLDASAYDGLSAHLIDSMALSNTWTPLLIIETNIFIGNPGSFGTSSNVSPAHLETWNLSESGKFTLNGSYTLSQPATGIFEYRGFIAARGTDNSLELLDDSIPSSLKRIAYDQPTTCLWYDPSQGDGEIGQGLWLPLGAYGVKEISLGP